MLISDLFIHNKSDFNEILNFMKKIFKLNKSLPENIFSSQFTNFKFNEFDLLMYDEFWDFIKTLNNITGDDSIIISVIDPDPIKYHFKHFNFFNTVKIPKEFSAEDYHNVLEFHLPDSEADAIIYISNVIVIFPISKKWAIWADRSYGIMVLGFNFNERDKYSKNLFEEWVSTVDIDTITDWVSYNFENENEMKNFINTLYFNYK
ncbi:hypothetical protein ABD91_18660 [Lysinibacillus sphaericus]|uniref:hypothetical protein n=1 Tax=Lysinibacillus sphaericus TaxID=1421 RepID=UPI0018CF502C|nr:hypothetical protein [Lysinibacillus sphaericus]MBG9692795.1 hypothetical protein [Lysinibacillus sphaericus]